MTRRNTPPTPSPAPSADVAFAAASTVLLVLLVAPLLALLVEAPYETFVGGWTDGELLIALATSFGCAAVAILLGLITGVPLAWLLERRRFRGRHLIVALLSLPLVVPHPVVGIALLLLFSRGRLLGSLLEGQLGIAVVGAAPGIILAMLFVSVPLIVRGAQQGFRYAHIGYEQAAESLGASPLTAVRTVSLPLARPAIVAGAMSAFARAVSEFGSVVVLAYFPRTAPVLIWDRFTAYGLAAAIPATGFMLLVTLLLFWLGARTEQRRRDLADG